MTQISDPPTRAARARAARGGVAVPRLLVSDVDGTLLDHNQRLPPASLEVLRALRQAGVGVALATGRVPVAMVKLCELLELDGPQVCSHGAIIVDPRTGETVGSWPLDAGSVEAGLDLAEELDVAVILCYANGFRSNQLNDDVLARTVPYGEPAPELVPDLRRFVDSQPLKAYLCTAAAQYDAAIAQARRALSDSCTVTSGDARGIELLNPLASKAHAVRILAEHAGLRLEDVAAIGDGPNDVDMLREVGVAVAMAHARPEVLAVADIVAPASPQGYADVIRKVFRLPPAVQPSAPAIGGLP